MNYLNGNNIAEYLANTPQITFEITERCNPDPHEEATNKSRFPSSS